MDVLVRVDQGAVEKIRFVSAGCCLDAGGLPFTWLTGVEPDDSVAWLSSLVTADQGKITDQALAAIAMHETANATAALTGLEHQEPDASRWRIEDRNERDWRGEL